MNKIKAKLPEKEDFSPWEESFINLVRSFDRKSARRPSPLRKQYLTLDCCKGHSHDKVVGRRELGRSLLSTSKINLKSKDGTQLEEELLVQQRSSRYQGPRLTFYSKMNPKCSDGSIASFKGIATRTLRHSFYDHSLLRDESIKYLNPDEPSSPSPPKCPRSIYPITSQASEVGPRRRE